MDEGSLAKLQPSTYSLIPRLHLVLSLYFKNLHRLRVYTVFMHYTISRWLLRQDRQQHPAFSQTF